MFLDEARLVESSVGYGAVGRGGSLGYEGKQVSVSGVPSSRALSAHGPSRLVFDVGGSFARFECSVGINGDVPLYLGSATFIVNGDGRELFRSDDVVSGRPPKAVSVPVAGVRILELVVQPARWEHCHSVWLDPTLVSQDEDDTAVDDSGQAKDPRTVTDVLGRTEARIPSLLGRPSWWHKCFATVVSPGYDVLLDDMLGSLVANGGCPDALLVVLAVDADDACRSVIAKYRAVAVECRPLLPVNPGVKSVLYSLARIVPAELFVCLDADTLVLGDLSPLFAALAACPPHAVLACPWHGSARTTLGAYIESEVCGGRRGDLKRLLSGAVAGLDSAEATAELRRIASCELVINDGVFAASRDALERIEGRIASMMPHAAEWVGGNRMRNEVVFNIAIAAERAGIELDGAYNVQLFAQDVEWRESGAHICASWRESPARVIHFSGSGRSRYPEWRGHYARIPDPLGGRPNALARERAVSPGGYDAFLTALRAWIGRHGTSALSWSFYGTTDGSGAVVRDPTDFPLFAALHYIVRSNGCVRVLEAGTGRGVSSACLATAVADRPGGRVVTYDPEEDGRRQDLWQALPEAAQRCIDMRYEGSLEGMSALIACGEAFDAALLDSLHTEEQVWREFTLARQLVCPGGLILIHDVRYRLGTVEAAIRRIEAAGYGVTRLWTAECGIPADDGLGLALIENRAQE